jgi:hypothetical protein
MNLKKLIFPFFLVLLLLSCNKEDENPANFSVAGNWKATAISSDNGRSVTETPIATFENEFTFTGADIDLEISFSESPNDFNSQGGYTQLITITDDMGGQNSQELLAQDFPAVGTWERSDNLITITAPDSSTQSFFILSLNATDMQLRYLLDATEDIGGGATRTQTATIFYTFEKN